MGYKRHHAIVLASAFRDRLEAVRDFAALSVGARVSDIVLSHFNGVYSFLVAPDGGFEGWGRSDDGDYHRDQIKEFIKANHTSDDGGNYIDWVEVQFGDDDLETTITDDSDAELRVVS